MTDITNDDIFAGSVGKEFVVETFMNLSSATLLQLRVKRPDKSVDLWTGVVYQTTKIRYVTGLNDLTSADAGKNYLQAYVEQGSYKDYGKVTSFEIKAVL